MKISWMKNTSFERGSSVSICRNTQYAILLSSEQEDGFIGFMGNITKGKKQVPLISEVKNLQEILEAVPTGVALINHNQHLIYANSVALEMFEGYPETEGPIRFGDFVRCINRNKDLRGCGYSDTCSGCLFFRAIRERLSSEDSSPLEEGEAYIAREHPLRPLWIRYKAKTLRIEMETYVLLSLDYITRQKETEAKLKAETLHFEHLFKSIPLAIAILDGQDRFMDCNQAFTEQFQYTREEVLGTHINDLIVLEGLEAEAAGLSNSALHGTPFYHETVRKRKDGTLVPVAIIGAPIELEGQILIYGIYQDISERKKRDDQIRALLAEKELLLREVHHRIKNTFNTLMSLLSLQRSVLQDKSAESALLAAENRIQCMSLLYDKLYRAESLKQVSLSEYLPPLIEEILSSFPKGEQIQVITKTEDIDLDVKTFQNLGIILNELITNSMKYAFQGRDSGIISVSARLDKDTVILEVSDNGVGIPEFINFEHSSGFGLQLVYLLAQQMGGEIRLERNQGTRFIVTIKTS